MRHEHEAASHQGMIYYEAPACTAQNKSALNFMTPAWRPLLRRQKSSVPCNATTTRGGASQCDGLPIQEDHTYTAFAYTIICSVAAATSTLILSRHYWSLQSHGKPACPVQHEDQQDIKGRKHSHDCADHILILTCYGDDHELDDR